MRQQQWLPRLQSHFHALLTSAAIVGTLLHKGYTVVVLSYLRSSAADKFATDHMPLINIYQNASVVMNGKSYSDEWIIVFNSCGLMVSFFKLPL